MHSAEDLTRRPSMLDGTKMRLNLKQQATGIIGKELLIITTIEIVPSSPKCLRVGETR